MMDVHTSFTPDSDNSRNLRDAFGKFATGVTVVTAASVDGPVGITVNSFASVSLNPPLVLWSSAKSSRRFNYFAQSEHYVIHVMGADQAELCDRFTKTAHVLDNHPHEINAHGVPMIDDCLARFECRQFSKIDGGDHLIILGQVLQAQMRAGDALTFYSGKLGETAQ